MKLYLKKAKLVAGNHLKQDVAFLVQNALKLTYKHLLIEKIDLHCFISSTPVFLLVFSTSQNVKIFGTGHSIGIKWTSSEKVC
jgi:hypothetical protein